MDIQAGQILITDQRELDELLHVRHIFSDGLYTKEIKIPKGFLVRQHVHKFSHQSILVSGKVVVGIGETYETKEYEGYNVIQIKAGVKHFISALEDSVWLCQHSTAYTIFRRVGLKLREWYMRFERKTTVLGRS